MNEPKTYRISHITDFLQVPPEKRALCVAEVLSALEKAHMAAHVLNTEAPMRELTDWGVAFVDWVDDEGNHLDIMAMVGGERVSLYESPRAGTAKEGEG